MLETIENALRADQAKMIEAKMKPGRRVEVEMQADGPCRPLLAMAGSHGRHEVNVTETRGVPVFRGCPKEFGRFTLFDRPHTHAPARSREGTEMEDDDLKASPRWHLIQKVLDVIDSGAETNRVWVLAIKIGYSLN